MFYPMEEQASHISKLREENRRYLKENGKLKARVRDNNAVNQESYNCYNNSNEVYSDPETTSDLEDRIMSLQLRNSELNLCLEREKRKRKEAEAKMERDGGYIRRLEDSVQTLRHTRVVMDPSTYRQVAEAYIAARGTPARRPNTYSGSGCVPGSDLVCDSSHDSVLGHQRRSHSIVYHSSSCPTSPNKYSSPPTSRRMYPKLETQEYHQMYPGEMSLGLSNKNKKDRSHHSHDLSRGLGVGVNTMSPWDYQQLLKSLEDLDGASRGALS